MYKKFFGRFIIGTVIFIFVWEFLLSLAFKRCLHTCFLSVQVPLHRIKTSLNQLQSRIALNIGSKDEWIQIVKELSQENAYLRLKLQEQVDQIDLSRRILELNKINVGENFKVNIARVIYRKYDTWNQFLIIDRGFKDGIEIGQGVICSGGIVGKIREVKSNIAFVELVTSASFRLLVKLEKDSAPYVLMGCAQTLNNNLIACLKGLEAANARSCPQQVETTALGQQFPNRMFIGQLMEVKSMNNEWLGTVQLGKYLHWLNEVCVLVPIKVL